MYMYDEDVIDPHISIFLNYGRACCHTTVYLQQLSGGRFGMEILLLIILVTRSSQ